MKSTNCKTLQLVSLHLLLYPTELNKDDNSHSSGACVMRPFSTQVQHKLHGILYIFLFLFQMEKIKLQIGLLHYKIGNILRRLVSFTVSFSVFTTHIKQRYKFTLCLFLVTTAAQNTSEPHSITLKCACIQRRLPSLIRVFTIRMKIAGVLRYPFSA